MFFLDGWKMWKKAFFFAGIPVIILGHINAFGMSDGSEHAAPEFIPYDHLRIRTKVNIGQEKKIFSQEVVLMKVLDIFSGE